MVAGISKPRTIGGMVETPGGVGTGGFAFDPARLAHKVLDLGSAVARQQGVGMSGNNAGEVRGLNSAPFQAGGAPNAAPSPDRGAVGRFWSEQMALGAGPSGAGALAPGGGPPGALGPGSAGEIGPAPKAIGTGPKALPPGPMSYTAGGFGGYPPQPPSAPSMIRRGGGGGGRPGGSAAAGIPSAVRT